MDILYRRERSEQMCRMVGGMTGPRHHWCHGGKPRGGYVTIHCQHICATGTHTSATSMHRREG